MDTSLSVFGKLEVPYANTHLAGNFTNMASKRPSSSLKNHFEHSKKTKSSAGGSGNGQNENEGFVDGAIVRVKMRNFV